MKDAQHKWSPFTAPPPPAPEKKTNKHLARDAKDPCLDIALQLLEQQDSELIDIMLGGGMRSFVPQGKRSLFGEDDSERKDLMDLVELWEVQGGKAVHELNTLLEVIYSPGPT